jgi:ribonuclease HI
MKKRKMSDAKDLVPIEVVVSVRTDPHTNLGGWGATISIGHGTCTVSGTVRSTDYCRLHLLGTVEALERLHVHGAVTIHGASRYVLAGVEQLSDWKARHWRTPTSQIVKNEDLWRRLDRSLQKHVVTWR